MIWLPILRTVSTCCISSSPGQAPSVCQWCVCEQLLDGHLPLGPDQCFGPNRHFRGDICCLPEHRLHWRKPSSCGLVVGECVCVWGGGGEEGHPCDVGGGGGGGIHVMYT